VTDYLDRAGLTEYLDQLGFQTVGYGCMTCIGNSGPLPDPVADAIERGQLIAASVLSGNRNFEGRINPYTKANYLASPLLVVAYAIAGTVDIDLSTEPIGLDQQGNKVYLSDIWPAPEEISEAAAASVTPEQFKNRYANASEGDTAWQKIETATGDLYTWDSASTYIREIPLFEEMTPEPEPIRPITDARCLVMVGDSVTTDHISPAGAIKPDSPAGEYLQSHGIQPADFNSYGSRRGNDQVMTRGTFANIRLRNLLAHGTEGGLTIYLPTDELMTIYDAAVRYKESDTPLVVLAGKEYGTGSSRDWAAKGTMLLGIRTVIAESFERIHRSNLVGMGILPLQFAAGQSRVSLGLTGREVFNVQGLDDNLKPKQTLRITATDEDGKQTEFDVICRIDTPVEIEYYRNGGILQTVIRKMLNQ
jgi:aconitate hydratase